MPENVIGALCYVFWILGVIVIVLEKENKFVRFHAIQSVAICLPLSLIGPHVYYLIPIGFLGLIILLPILISGLILTLVAFSGGILKLPIVGDFAEKYA